MKTMMMGKLILDFGQQGGVRTEANRRTSHLKGATVTVSREATRHRNNQTTSIFGILIFLFLW